MWVRVGVRLYRVNFADLTCVMTVNAILHNQLQYIPGNEQSFTGRLLADILYQELHQKGGAV